MSLRRIALDVLLEITQGGKYANLALKSALKSVEHSDAAWVSALVYETLDRLILIDYIIDAHAKGKMNPKIRGILRLGVCQALFMDTPESAACNETVKLTSEIGKGALKGFVNGVMRNICRTGLDSLKLPDDPIDRLSVKHSYPRWLAEEYYNKYGVEFTEQMLSYRHTGMTIRAQAPYTSAELEESLRTRGLPYMRGNLIPDAFKLERGFDVQNDELFTSGKLTVQSESAMLVCRACEPKRDMYLLDACCAPGGKTAYLSMLMENTGRIDAWEVHPHRAKLAENTLLRLGVKNAVVKVRDASASTDDGDGIYDALLLDVPCSGLGVLGKPDVRYAKSPETLDELSILQYSILSNCCKLVKVGGAIIYATCTVSSRENECVIDRFISEHKDFCAEGLAECVPECLKARVKNSMLQLFPHIDDTEGFFIARIVRKA